LLEWGGGGSFRDYIFEKHNEWGCGRRKWEINDNKVFGVIKEPVIVLKELNDSKFFLIKIGTTKFFVIFSRQSKYIFAKKILVIKM